MVGGLKKMKEKKTKIGHILLAVGIATTAVLFPVCWKLGRNR